MFLKPDFRKILVKIINFNGNELIWLDRKLSWPPNNIFRHGSKPKSLQTCRNLFGNAQNHPPTKPKHVNFSENRFLVGKLFLQKSTSYGSSGRSAKWKMLVHWSSSFHNFCKNLISTIKNGFLPGVLISTPVFHEKTLFHLEPSGIYFLKNI